MAEAQIALRIFFALSANDSRDKRILTLAMATLGKVLLGILVSILIVIGVAALYLHHAIQHPDQYLPKIVAYAEQKTGKQIAVRHIELKIWPTIRVRAYGVEVKNPKPFPPGDFLNIPELDGTVRWAPLLEQKISIRSVVLKNPTIDFISDPDGLWNFQNRPKPGQKARNLSVGTISKVDIQNGVLLGSALIDPQDAPGPVVLEVRDFAAQLSNIDSTAFSAGKSSHPIQGQIQAGTARFGVVHTTDLRSNLRLTPAQLIFKNFHAKTHDGHASGDFTFNYGEKKPSFQTRLHVTGIKVDYLLRQFQPGPPKMTGMMEATLDLSGVFEHSHSPLAGIHGGGQFTIHNGELPSLNKSSSMAQMKRFREPAAKSLPVSAFSTFAGDMDLDSHRIDSRRIGVDFYGVDIDGSGTLDEINGGMDYRGTATIMKRQGFFTDLFAKWFKDAQTKDGRLVFPIKVKGTLKSPQFSIVD